MFNKNKNKARQDMKGKNCRFVAADARQI